MNSTAIAEAVDRAVPKPSAAPRRDGGAMFADTQADTALGDLLALLDRGGYHFVTPTPATHQRVVARRRMAQAASIADVLGWSRPFRPGLLDGELLRLLHAAGVLAEAAGGLLQSTIRVSRLHDRLFIHSAYPTDAAHAVFLGPDSYRFADLIATELDRKPLPAAGQIVDIGCGAGVGAVVAAARCPGSPIAMVDINPTALRFARINAAAAGVAARFLCGDSLRAIGGPIRLAVANPPFIVDDAARAYRHGGRMYGTEVALAMAGQAVERLAPDGRLILYTGSAIVAGADPLGTALADLARGAGRALRYREIDPDVFGEELDRPAYADVDRIALVAAIIGPIA